MKKSRLSKLILSTIIGVCAANSLYAKDKKDLGEIVIEGSKLENTLLETVGGVQVLDEVDFLNSSSLNDMYDVFEQTSNINRSGKYAFNIRGINSTGIAGSYIGPRTINVSLDGVSQGSNASKQGAISTWDIDHVEILKGPQSTTQGRNSLAGAVVIKTKDPEFIANGAAQAKYGSNNTYQLSAMQNSPINENMAIRLSVDRQSSDGFVTNNTIRSDEFNKRDITTFRGKLLYLLDNDASILFNVSKNIYDDYGHSMSDNNRQSPYNTDGFYNSDALSNSIEVDVPLNDKWSLKSITSYSNEHLTRRNDLDYFAGNAIANFQRKNDSINQELRLNYKSEKIKSVFGLYYSNGKGTDDRKVSDLEFRRGVFVDYQQYLEEKYSNSALFFNTDYSLTNNFTFIFGSRLDKDTRKNISTIDAQRINDLGSSLNTIIDAQLAAIANGDISAKDSTTNFLPKLGFDYKWTENVHTGFIYSKGYRPGGVSVNPITAVASKYDTEHTNNFELSFKSLWLDKRLMFNANIFLTKWKNQQVLENGSSGSPFDSNTINSGESTLKGIEFDTRYEINDEIDVYGNIGYIKAKYDEYISSGNNYSGNEIIKTPNVTGNIGINYRNNKGYFIGGNINYVGSQYGDSANERKISPYSIVNLKTGYEQDDWALYLFANNLFDRKYEINNYGSGRYELGDERVVGVTLKYYW
ncbi:TonB-dependent receptor [Campylobacterota bacterium DY0563]